MKSNVYMYGGIIYIYILTLLIWIIFCFVDSLDEGGEMSNPLVKVMVGEVICIYIYFSYVF